VFETRVTAKSFAAQRLVIIRYWRTPTDDRNISILGQSRIGVLDRVKKEDLAFLKMMFQRRHVYEHNGGGVDQKYIDQSGDKSMRVGQAIRETRSNAERFCDLLQLLSQNLHEGFHSIVPVEETAVRMLRPDTIKS